MSWLYSRALVEEYSEGSDLDGEQSAQSSGNHTQQAYCAPDKMTAFSKRSLSGMTFKPLMENRGEDVLTSFLAAFPVKTSPAPEREQASQENDPPCGHTWRELCLRCDPDTSSLRTVRCLWEEDLEPSSVTLPRWGMMQDGELWERTTLPHRIRETESGSSESWPTPTANEDAAGTPNGKMQGMLGNHPYVRGETPEEWKQGSLNPDWVEWLMGWPIGWTRLESIALDERGWDTDPADTGDIPRVATGIVARADRLKAIGNGQVPQAAELAWRILTK